MAAKSSRAVAAKLLHSLLGGSSGSLSNLLDDYRERPDFPLLQELCFGACRWYPALDVLLTKLLSKPLKNKDGDVRCLLILGLYQLRELDIADYAVINESVEASRGMKKPWAAALVNAVLRNYLRQKAALESELSGAGGAAACAHPDWLYEALRAQYPDLIERLCAGNNARPPMTLRVNRAQTSVDDYLESLREIGIHASQGQCASTALVLESPCHVDELPGFRDGWVSVQDEASQLVPSLMQLGAGLRFVDACAAPGGKTAAVLEAQPDLLSVTAIDASAKRLVRVDENLKRLGLDENKVRLCATKAEDTDSWWDGEPVDRLLLDAPCSATGVIRRHPDIKVLRTPAEVESCVQSQRSLLDALWPTVAEGGLLLYTTCSVLGAENNSTIEAFLDTTANAKSERIEGPWGVECLASDGRSLGRALLPLDAKGPDGFFFALLRKTSPASKSA